MMKKILMKYIPYCLLWCFSLSSHAEDSKSEIDMVAVERAIDASKNYQGKVSCGKIDMGNKRYTFRIPEIYQRMRGIEYHGDSNWVAGGIVKKENPCLYDIKVVLLSFFWPSMKPSDGFFSARNQHDPKTRKLLTVGESQANDINASIRRFVIGNSGSAFEWGDFIRSLKTYVMKDLGTSYKPDSIKNEDVLAMGKYLPELGLYFYSYNRYREPMPYELKVGPVQKKRRDRADIFWKLDSSNRVTTVIQCRYLRLDPSEMTQEQSICEQKTRLYEYDASSLTIRYGGRYVKDWEKIQQATIQQFKIFITEERLP